MDGSGRSDFVGTVFLFKNNLVYIINYFMFVFSNENFYEKRDQLLVDFNNDNNVSKLNSSGYCKRSCERQQG